MICEICGKSMKGQGNQWTCMNEKCSNYLVQIEGKKVVEKKKPSLADRLKNWGK